MCNCDRLAHVCVIVDPAERVGVAQVQGVLLSLSAAL